MKRSVIVLSIIGIIILGGCASAPRVSDPSGVDISVVRLTLDQAMMLSFTDGPNPYQAPGGLISHPDEFVVLRFVVVAAQKAEVSVDSITALNPDGGRVAKYVYIDGLSDYINSWNAFTRAQSIQVVQNTYLPGDHFQVGPGHHTYYAVLIGKNPIPRPFTVEADVSVDDGQPRNFSFNVTDSK
jgi:hypothetical protein